ncbi:MAG: acetyl-CoA carboxylase biotin carboxylase subunit [Acidobacteria bacterium]|nr:acetyl-CoA carboxylase biotin carboxylase subunit [Acidobacteriota bacterium]
MKVLVANRGEIAVRVMRACRETGVPTVGVYSPSDRLAPHVRYADEAIGLGADRPAESYLDIGKLIDAARRTGADTVHPGYGFLAENAEFAAACRAAGLCFVGPSADVIELMGGKTASRAAAQAAGVPVVPGTDGPLAADLPDEDVRRMASSIGYPVFVKAVAGGGGKGMRLVQDPDALLGAVRAARSEAGTAFGNPAVYLERYVSVARHIEVQLLGDEHGNVVPFVERECSIQRRHQKVIEETPSVAVDTDTRRALGEAAANLARGVGYANAGTVEFLLDDSGRFYFLEMNTRLQGEHPITEVGTGGDLVRWQLRIARGERLALDPERMLTPRGHAIECRVYAEDPEAGFVPCPGRITTLRTPDGPGIRNDSGVAAGYDVPLFYDSMLSKLVAWGENRSEAIDRMARALTEYEIGGVRTTIPLFRWMLRHPDFLAGRFDTGYLDRTLAGRPPTPLQAPPAEAEEVALLAAAIHAVTRAASGRPVEAAGAPQSSWRQAARAAGLRR